MSEMEIEIFDRVEKDRKQGKRFSCSHNTTWVYLLCLVINLTV